MNPRIAWKGRDAAALPTAGLPAVIHSVYARACNIQLPDGRLLALLTPALPRIAWGVGLTQLPRPFSSFLRAGMPCQISAAGLRVDGNAFSLRWDTAPFWEHDSLRLLGPTSPHRLRQLSELAARTGWAGWTPLTTLFAADQYNFAENRNNYVAKPHNNSGIFAAFATSGETLRTKNIPPAAPSPVPATVPPSIPAGISATAPAGIPLATHAVIPADDILLRHAAALCQKLAQGWRTQCAAEVNAAACGMVGLGIGLTPSGDDFLGGMLAGLHVTATPEQRQMLLRPLCTALHTAAQGTGAVAASFLRHACRNSFSHTVVELAQLLHSSYGATEEIQAQVLEYAAAALLNFGSTSGADTLAGLLFAAQLTEKTA